MKENWVERLRGSRYFWAALAGLGLAAAFPKAGVAGLAWLAPGGLLFSAMGTRGGRCFRVGYVGGLAYALAAFYWILLVPFPAGAVAGWLALSAYMATYTASWVWLCWRFAPGASSSTEPEGESAVAGARSDGISPALVGLAEARWFRRAVWAMACAGIWVALEMILARLFTGFPWNLLGASQFRILPLIQIASVTGVYGVSFLVVWFSIALAMAAARFVVEPRSPRAWATELVCPGAVLALVVALGVQQLSERRPAERSLEAVLIQPSIPQTLIWDTNKSAARFNELLALSERALQTNSDAQLLVWPEAAVPNMLRYDRQVYVAVTNLAMTHRVWMVLGSDDAAPRPGGTEREYDYYNSSFLVSPEGEIAASYQKRRLVIFGEYIPLERWVPFMKYLTPVGGSFAIGRGPVPFFLPELQVTLSVLICFEDIFPHYTREYVGADTDFLLNLTNNGWFGESAAQWQHAANAVFRAVEGRIPLVRCTNNGLTCWVDAWGGLHDVFFDNAHTIYGAGFKAVQVPLLGRGERRSLTFYTRHGDGLGWSCVGLTGVLAAWAAVSARRGPAGKRFAPAREQDNR